MALSDAEGKVMEKLELFYIFRAAIDDEKRAQRRYKEAIKLTEDRPELSSVFVEILREEQNHEKRLVSLYKKHKAEFES